MSHELVGTSSHQHSLITATRRWLAWRHLLATILAVAVLLSGLGLTALVHRTQTFLVAIEGSEPANFPSFNFNFTVGGPLPENFVTAAPAGAAFLLWRYNHPVRLQYITQSIVGSIDAAKAMRAFSLQYRDVTGSWKEVLRGSWSDTESTKPHTLSIPDPQSGPSATEWRLLALEGGADGEIIIGYLSPIPWISSGAMGSVNSLSLDVLMFLSVFLAAGVLAAFNRHKAGAILFFGGCVAAFFVVNVLSFWFLRLPLLWAPDSSSYIEWPPNFARMPAMSLIYVLLLKLLHLKQLHALQINIMIVSYFAALGCVSLTAKRYWPFVPFTAFPLTWGNFVLHGSYVLSEAWFISGLLIGLSGIIALIMGGGRRSALWAGAGLLLALCARPLGVILLVPVILAYRFVPGQFVHRLQLIALAVLPPIMGYVVMSAYGYTLSGHFAPTSFNGISLSGHVAWMLDPNDLPEEYRKVGREAVAELESVYSDLPPMSKPEQFVDFTVNNISTAVYLILLPRFTRAVALAFPALSHNDPMRSRNDVLAEWWTSNRAQMNVTNDVLGAWAWKTVKRNPIRYATNCILNYQALWRDGFAGYLTVGQWWRWRMYWAGYRLGTPEAQRYLPNRYNEYASRWRQATEPYLIIGREFRLSSVRINEFHRNIGWVLMIVSLTLVAMYVLPIHYNPTVAGIIVWGLFVNAMFGGHVLFTSAAARYGEPMVPLVPLLGALTLEWFGKLAQILFLSALRPLLLKMSLWRGR